MADIGWITGHSYIVYGPLALAATSVIYEGVPKYPDAGRPWRIAERLGVNIFHTSPTAIRMLRKAGPDEPGKYNYHFKHMTTVGEPIEPEVWRWYHEVVGKGEAVIVDTWWQTENGGFLCSTLPALDPMKPGSCGPAVLGIYPGHLRRGGQRGAAGSGKAGNICITQPVAGDHADRSGATRPVRRAVLRQVLQEPEQQGLARLAVLRRRRRGAARRTATPDPGPGGRRDQRRRPPAGHQGARVGLPDRARGGRGGGRSRSRRDQGAGCRRCTSRSSPGIRPSDEIGGKVTEAIETEIGKIARPKNVYIVPDMPKTRSGKIMRRVLAAISNFTDMGDVTTLANPEVVDGIRRQVRAAKVAKGDVPRELSETEKAEIKVFGAES